MEKYPYLSKAPVVEAILDIRTTPAEEWDETSFTENVKSQFGSEFTFEPENSLLYTILLDPSAPGQGNIPGTGWNGLRVFSADKTEIFKLVRDSFVYSKLNPYTGWESFKERGLLGWNRYRAIAGRQTIKKIGIRFINRIDFTADELSRLLNIYPVKIGKIDKDIAGYFQQNTYAFENGKILTKFIQAVQPPAEKNANPSIILDIDVFSSGGLPLSENDVDLMMERFRQYKNDIFFGAITDALLERLR